MADATNGNDLTDDSALSVIEASLKCFHVVSFFIHSFHSGTLWLGGIVVMSLHL